MAIRTVRLGGGDDAFSGTAADELVYGMGGSDRLAGEDGDDRLFSNDAFSFAQWLERTLVDRESWIEGGGGDDEVESYGTRLSVATGGPGDDDVVSRSYGSACGSGGAGDDVVGVSGERGDARASGGAGADLVAVKARFGYAEALGGPGDDALSVDVSATARLAGDYGDDFLVVTGATAKQATVILGGAGADIMQGHEVGREIFRFEPGDTGVAGRADEIGLFGEEDLIDLRAIDANGAAAGNGRFCWGARGNDPGAGEIVLEEVEADGGSATLLSFDDGRAHGQILLTDLLDASLGPADFLL